MIRVVVAEDHETVRQGLKLLIDSQDDMEVVGEAGDGRAALRAIAAFEPDVAVIDISMPELNGVAVARQLRVEQPRTRAIALTRYDDLAYVNEFLRAGALGYVLKQSASAELLAAIRAAARGERYLDAALSRRSTRGGQLTEPTATDREVEVLRRTAQGHSNKEIAAALNISVKTVEVHKANGMRKLGLEGRIDVVRYAVLHGWLHDA